MECHAFLCPKRKTAQAATLTIAQAFNLAFDCWKEVQEKRKRQKQTESQCRCGCERKEGGTIVSSPSSGYNSAGTAGSEETEPGGGGGEERLLIDLSSPGDGLQETSWEDVRILDSGSRCHTHRPGWTKFEEEGQTFSK